MTDTVGNAIERILSRLAGTSMEDFSGFPHFADGRDGRWTRTADGDWTGGFFVGQLWLAAAATDETRWYEWARDWSERLRPRISSDTVFRGFLFWYGAALGNLLLSDEYSRLLAVEGAVALAKSFHPAARLLPLGSAAEEAHSVGREETNIDGVPGGVPLLFWAARETDQPSLAAIARSHATRHKGFCLRADGSVAQSASFHPDTGELLRTYTHKGIHDASTWGRAQAWAMLGLSQAARWDRQFVPAACHVADWWIAHLPATGVSYWDFNAAADEEHPAVDTSATAIAAASLLKLASLSPQRGAAYRESANTMLHALLGHLTPTHNGDPRPAGMLMDGCYNRRIGLAVANELVWGDYFLLEALLAQAGLIDSNML